MVAVSGWGVVSPAGVGRGPFRAAVAAGSPGCLPETGGPCGTPALAAPARAATGFNVRELLGRKGTSSFDRHTGLAIVACGEALDDSGLDPDHAGRDRVGVVLGITVGSLKSTMDFSGETLTQDRPYLVNPALFPNTVLNCAAGQAGVRYRLKGVNATLAGGRLAFLNALAYAVNALRRGYADALLTVGAEELTPHAASAAKLSGGIPPAGIGEGAAAFAVELADPVRAAGRHVDCEVLAVATGQSPSASGLASAAGPGAMAGQLRRCIVRALARAGAGPGDVATVALGEAAWPGRAGIEKPALDAVLGAGRPERIRITSLFGECQAATGALQFAALAALHRDDPGRDGRISLMTSWTAEGGVGAAVLRGWSRAGADRR